MPGRTRYWRTILPWIVPPAVFKNRRDFVSGTRQCGRADIEDAAGVNAARTAARHLGGGGVDLAADGVGVPLFRALDAELDDRDNDSRLALRLISKAPGAASRLRRPGAVAELRRHRGVVWEEHVGFALRHGGSP